MLLWLQRLFGCLLEMGVLVWGVEVVCLEGGEVMVMKGVLFNELEVCMVLMKVV